MTYADEATFRVQMQVDAGPFLAAGAMWLAVRAALAFASSHFAGLAPDYHVARLFAGAGVGILVYALLVPVVARPHLKLLFEQFGRLRREMRPTGTEPATVEP